MVSTNHQFTRFYSISITDQEATEQMFYFIFLFFFPLNKTVKDHHIVIKIVALASVATREIIELHDLINYKI